MIKNVLAASAVLALAGLAGCDTLPWTKTDAPVPYPPSLPAFNMNGVLALPTGMTLYRFDADAKSPGTSACNDDCAKVWPPFVAPADAGPTGNFTVITRADGSKQWAYRGVPLYTYSGDTRAGDVRGDNFKNVWHTVAP